MYIVVLKLAHNRDDAARHAEAHAAWIEAGFAAGTFVAVGNLAGGAGGAVIAVGVNSDELSGIVAQDPFVASGVVDADIIDIEVWRAAEGFGVLQR